MKTDIWNKSIQNISNDFDREILNLLYKKVIKDLDDEIFIKIENDSSFCFESIAKKFPICGTQIDWTKLSERFEAKIEDLDDIESIIKYFSKIIQKYDLNGNVIYCCDNSVDFTIQTDITNIQLLFPILLEELPAHHYIVSKNISWCFVSSMEGYIDFGYSPSEKRTRE